MTCLRSRACGDRVDYFIQANLDRGLPDEVADGGPYEVVLCADILEHVRQPEQLLEAVRGLLAPGGVLIASVPNFGHWYARVRTALGLFDYDQRGVLDNGHVRFFTRRGLLRRLGATLATTSAREEATGLPLDVLLDGEGGILRRFLRYLTPARHRAPNVVRFTSSSACVSSHRSTQTSRVDACVMASAESPANGGASTPADVNAAVRPQFTVPPALAAARGRNHYISCPACGADVPRFYLFYRAGARFVICRACGLVYADPVDPEAIADFDLAASPVCASRIDLESAAHNFSSALEDRGHLRETDRRSATFGPCSRSLASGV